MTRQDADVQSARFRFFRFTRGIGGRRFLSGDEIREGALAAGLEVIRRLGNGVILRDDGQESSSRSGLRDCVRGLSAPLAQSTRDGISGYPRALRPQGPSRCQLFGYRFRRLPKHVEPVRALLFSSFPRGSLQIFRCQVRKDGVTGLLGPSGQALSRLPFPCYDLPDSDLRAGNVGDLGARRTSC